MFRHVLTWRRNFLLTAVWAKKWTSPPGSKIKAAKCRSDLILKTHSGLIKFQKILRGQTRWNELKFRFLFRRVPDVCKVQQRIFAEMLPDMKKFSFNTRDVLCSDRSNQYLPIDNEKEKCYLRFFLHRTFFWKMSARTFAQDSGSGSFRWKDQNGGDWCFG